MTAPSYRPLRILLFAISAIEGIAGLALVFAAPLVLASAPPIVLPNANFVQSVIMALGVIALALSYLLCVTARDPVRYVAVIDTLVFILVAAALVEIYAIAALHAETYYPGPYLIVRAIVQIALAAVFVALRPRRATAI